MSVLAKQIRRAPVAGSGIGEPNPAANSRVEEKRETANPGPATDKTDVIVMPLRDGGELRFCAVHGRVEVLVRVGKGRVFATTPVTPERGEYYGARITEISQHARAQRDSKGA